MKPGLTTLVVFTTGEGTLRRCLESVRAVSVEIVAVDTGAKDDARKVAEEFGARIYDLVWPDSFADAYNFAMDKVDTEWTLLLDTDEWLLPESEPMLRALMKDDTCFAARLLRQDMADDVNYSEMVMLRLWRTHPEMRMRGIIHAQFPGEALEKVGGGRAVRNTDIRFRHDGFKGGLTPDKLRRNIPYLERELEERPGQMYFELDLASSLLLVGDERGAPMINTLADKLLDSDLEGSQPMYLAGLVHMALEVIPPEELKSERTRRLIDIAWKHFGYVPHLMWVVGEVESLRENYQGEFRALVRMEEMADTGNYTRLTIFDPIIFHEALWSNLLIVAHRLGRSDVAKRCFDKLKTWNPDYPLVKQIESDIANAPGGD